MGKDGTADKLDKLISRVDILISILLEPKLDGKKTTIREQVEFLNTHGLEYKEIARLFNKSPGYIASELTLIRKKRGRK